MHHIDKHGCLDDLEEALNVHGQSVAGLLDDNQEQLTELLETGSVTMETPVGKFVFTLGAWEELR